MITLFSKIGCSKCVAVASIFEGRGVEFKKVDVEKDTEAMEFVLSKGFQSLPVILKEGKEPIGFTNVSDLLAYIN